MFFYRENLEINNNPYSLGLNLSNIVFTNTLLNGQVTGSVTVSATGTGTESVTLTDNSNQFTASPSSFNLAGGASQIVTLTFTPTGNGLHTGSVFISASGGSTAQLNLSGTGMQFVETQTLFGTAIEDPLNNSSFNASSIAVSNNGLKLFSAASNGVVHVYQKISGSFEFQQVIETAVDLSQQHLQPGTDSLSCNQDGSIFVIGLHSNEEAKIKIYQNNSGSYQLSQTIVSENSNDFFGFGVVMSLDGDTIVVRDTNYEIGNSSHIYARNGAIWELEQTINLSNYLGRTVEGTGGPIRINSASDRLFLGCSDEDGNNEIHIFNKVSGTWTYSDGIVGVPLSWTSENPTLTSYLDFAHVVAECASINSLGNKLAIRVEGYHETLPIHKCGIVIYNSSSLGWGMEQIISGNLITNYAPGWATSYDFNSTGDILTVLSNDVDTSGNGVLDENFVDPHGVVSIYVKNTNSWVLSQVFTNSVNNSSVPASKILIDSSGSNIFVAKNGIFNLDGYQGAVVVFEKQ